MKRLLLYVLANCVLGSLTSGTIGQYPSGNSSKQLPQFEVPSFCPPEGSSSPSSDEELNKKRNRIDESGRYEPVALDAIGQLPWPPELANRRRRDWKTEDLTAIARYEGTPIMVQGYLVKMPSKRGGEGAIRQGPESCNCGRSELKYVDFILRIVAVPGGNQSDSIVAEMTPRIRKGHPQWTIDNLGYIARERLLIRVYGWLVLDQYQIAEVGHSRSTPWQIHPITQIQVRENGRWKTL